MYDPGNQLIHERKIYLTPSKILNNKPSRTRRFFIQQDFPPPWIVSSQAGVFHPGPLHDFQQQTQSNSEVFIQEDFPSLWIVSPQAGVFHPGPLQISQQQAQSTQRVFLPYKNYVTPQTKSSTKYFSSNHETPNHPLS